MGRWEEREREVGEKFNGKRTEEKQGNVGGVGGVRKRRRKRSKTKGLDFRLDV